MKIERLTARNLKGCTFEHALAPVTLFHGNNFAGKTARLDALTLALGGFLPKVASKPNEVFDRLASGNPLDVELVMERGYVVRRTWTRQPGGSVKAACSVTDFEMPAVAIDPDEFLGLSARERVKFLFGRCKLPGDLTEQSIVRTLVANVKNVRLEANSEASEAAIASAVTVLNETTLTSDKDRTVQDYAEALVECVGEKKKLSAANVQRMEKTLQGLAQTAAQGVPPQDADRRLAETRKALEAAVAEQARAAQEANNAASKAKEAERLASAAVDEKATLREVVRLEAELGEGLDARVPEPGKPPVQRMMTTARPDTTFEQDARNRAMEELNKLSAAAMLAKAERDKQAALMEQAAELKVCPTCGQSVVEVQKQVVKRCKAELAKAEKAAELAEKRVRDFPMAKFERDLERKEAEAESWDDAAAKLFAENTEAMEGWAKQSAAWNAAQKVQAALREQVMTLRARLADNVEAARAAAALPELRSRAEALERMRAGAEAKVRMWRQDVQAAEESHRRLMAWRAEEAARAKAAAELEKVSVESEVWKEVQKLVAALQAKLVEAAVGPLVARANELCGSILRAPLAIKEGELCMEGVGASHRTFSGTEKALAYCALSVALADGAPVRLAVFDEVGRLDARNKLKLVETLLDLTAAGKLDQAVLVDTVPLGVPEMPASYAEIEVK